MAIIVKMAIIGQMAILTIMVIIARYGCQKERLGFRNAVTGNLTIWNIFFKEKNEKRWRAIFSFVYFWDFLYKIKMAGRSSILVKT